MRWVYLGRGPLVRPIEEKVSWSVLFRKGRSVRGVGSLDRVRKLDMVQHCKWIAYGTDGLGGKGCTRMRPKLHLPVQVFGHAFRVRVTGVMASILVVRHLEGCVVSHPSRSIRE